jgi:hypothetical protein
MRLNGEKGIKKQGMLAGLIQNQKSKNDFSRTI